MWLGLTYLIISSIIELDFFCVFRGVLHATLAKARAVSRRSNMASALLKGKPTIQWRTIT